MKRYVRNNVVSVAPIVRAYLYDGRIIRVGFFRPDEPIDAKWYIATDGYHAVLEDGNTVFIEKNLFNTLFREVEECK